MRVKKISEKVHSVEIFLKEWQKEGFPQNIEPNILSLTG
jgi:hypothetical protein